jgi:rubrerythrin
MTTKTVFYSISGRSRMVAEGTAAALDCQLYGLTDRFSSHPDGWKRAARRAVQGFDLGVLNTPGVSFDRRDRLVLVLPYWNGAVVPAVSGFVRSVELTGVTVFLVITRHVSGGGELISQLEDDIVRQGGTIGGAFSLRTLWRTPQGLRSLGTMVGQRIGREPQGTPFSLQELLEEAIEDEVEAHARYLQLIEMTPNRRLKATFGSIAAGKVAHAQELQQLHSALLQGLSVAVEAERKAFMGYQAIAARYPSQPDVVRHLLALSRSDLRHHRDMRSMYNVLSRHHSTY